MAIRKRTIWNLADGLEGDKVVWIIALMLILISIVCIFSSTSRLLIGESTRVDIVSRQLFIVAGGFFVIFSCYLIKDIRIYRYLSKWGFAISFILLLILAMKKDLGFIKPVNINNAWRILKIGSLQIHVLEIVKVAMIMYISWAMDALKKREFKLPIPEKWKKIAYIYAPFVLITVLTIPASNTAAIFIAGIMTVVILLGGGSFKDFLILGAIGLCIAGSALGIWKISGGKAFSRIGTFMGRFEDHDYVAQFHNSRKNSIEYQEALDMLRQPYGAKIAIKEGGPFGKGPGQSTQRYYVPDMPEDYMFSFIIEEYGLWGALFTILLYVSLLARGSLIARHSGQDLYAKLAVAGLCILISGQAFLHMFVNADIGPMTGQTLPLISHGNSAFLCFSLAFGIILSFSRIAERNIEKERKNAEAIYVSEDGKVQED